MNEQYTIGQLARAAGVPTTTLRYYERMGLVRPTRGRRISIGSIPGIPSRSFASSVPHKRPGFRSPMCDPCSFSILEISPSVKMSNP